MIKRPYINKRGRLVLGEEQKKHKETKRQMFRCTSIPLTKVALSVFGSGKRRKHGKKKQNNYGKTRCSKKSYSIKQ